MNNDSGILDIFKEFALFLKYRQKYWLAPVIIGLLAIGCIIASTGGALSPFFIGTPQPQGAVWVRPPSRPAANPPPSKPVAAPTPANAPTMKTKASSERTPS